MEFNAEAMGEHVLIRGRAVTTEKVLGDVMDRYEVALWAMQMPCESCPMAHPCMTLAASVGETACRRGFEARVDEWRELWRKMG